MTDFSFKDTPAIEVLAKTPALAHIDPADVAAAQDVLRLSKKLLGAFAEEFALRGLSPGRYAVMMALQARAAPLAPSELADRLGVTRATVTGLVSGLARDGLVAYGAEGADRRRKEIALTRKGRALFAKVLPDVFAQMVELLTPLSRAERVSLLAMLRKVERGLRAPAPHKE